MSSRQIWPSLLGADWSRLADELKRLEDAGVDGFHLDVMDGRFVPNITFGPRFVATVRDHTRLPMDAHLMIVEPEKYVESFARAGADYVTVHVEAADDPAAVLTRIRRAGAKAGLALNPATPVESVEPFVEMCDLVLVMSVVPGFGGQSFMPEALPKLRRLKECAGRTGVVLQIDGGIGTENIRAASEAGADILVAGASITRESDYAAAVATLRAALEV